MTLDDLVKVFEDACREWDSAYDPDKPVTYGMKWYGMRAVSAAIAEEAVLGGKVCQSSEQHTPETASNDEQRG